LTALRDWLRRSAPVLLMLASGAAGLGYQVVWTQQRALWLGHEAPAVLAVITAFFGGIGLGALGLGSRVERSSRPARWYVGCELLIAGWSLLLVAVSPAVNTWTLRVTGAEPAAAWQWLIAFCSTFLLLLPATAAMGVTLPAMERLTAQLRSQGRSIALLYASNTFGAVLGVLLVALWLVPSIGLARSTLVCAGLNLLCAVVALGVFAERSVVAEREPKAAAARALLGRLAATGLLGIGYEVVVVRVLSQVTEDTVYTFALLLAVYLLGSAAGAGMYQRWLATRRESIFGDRLLVGLAVACLVSTVALGAAETTKAWALDTFGPGVGAALGAEALLALGAFALPTLLMGALFSHLSRAASASGVTFGRALGANTLGATAAPPLFGVLLVPAFGAKQALLLIALCYLALTARRAWLTLLVCLPAAGALVVAVMTPPLTFVTLPEAGRVVSYREGVMAAVSVVEDAHGVAVLRIDNRQQEGSSATLRADARQAWLPLLLHPAPRKALFLGLGTGVTSSSAAADPSLQVDAVELLPEVVAASSRFVERADQARLHVVIADARRFVRADERRYDVIVADNFHPARSGSGALYTAEHFMAVRGRLESGGIFCQWLPLHQLDLQTLRSITQTFLVAFPEAWGVIASNSLETPVVGLVGRADSSRFDAQSVRSRLAGVMLRDAVDSLGFEDEYAVLGSAVAGPAALRRFAASAALNTDDHPVVAYRAPFITYAPDSNPGSRLTSLLAELSIGPDELLDPPVQSQLARRLAAYWAARNTFVASGRSVQPGPRVEDMLAQVRQPLLSALRLSPDFRPAYDPLLAMAKALARSNLPAARALLAELMSVQPARSEAAEALILLDDSESGSRVTR
jgi:spermidine synthase